GGCVAWPIIARSHLIEKRPRLCVAGEYMMRGDKMIVLAMSQRADQGISVGASGEARQMLANVEARHLGSDGLELAPDLRGRIRLHVKRIEVARSTRQENQDDGLWLPGTSSVGPPRGRRLRPLGQQ